MIGYITNSSNMAGTQTRELDATLGDNYVMALELCIVLDIRKIININTLGTGHLNC
jgi:hypothetical protein